MGSPTTGVNRWIIAGTVLFGTFIAVMDISVVNVALPNMMGAFGQSLADITWVATSYSIAEITMATMAGWWSRLLGRKTTYLLSFALFTIGSILSGLSTSFPELLAWRVLQGVGGGSLIPISQAILRESFPPEEQGLAMAIYGMGVVLAPAIGPILGGWLTDNYGWPWIFYINVPVSIVGMLLVSWFIHDPDYLKRGVSRIDWGGLGLLITCITAMQVVLERGEQNDWFSSDFIVWGTVLSVVAGLGFIVWELYVDDPIVNLRILRNLPLTIGSGIGLVFGVALYATTFIIPQFTQELLGYPSFQAGLVLLPRAITLMLMMPVAGWLYRHTDSRMLVIGGVLMMAGSLFDLGHLSLSADFHSLIPSMLVMGAGMPFMFVTLSTVALSTLPRDAMTEGSALYTLARRIGGNVGYALVASVVASRGQFHHIRLGSHLTPYSQDVTALRHALSTQMQHPGAGMAMIARMLNAQATMMAYNDASHLMAWMFLVTLPLVLFLPRPRKASPAPAHGE